MAHFNKRQQDDRRFKGIEEGQRVEHAYDHTAVGVVTGVVFPIIFVQLDGKNSSHPMDRDELRPEGFFFEQKQNSKKIRKKQKKEGRRDYNEREAD